MHIWVYPFMGNTCQSFIFQIHDDVDWQVLKPQIFATIMDFFATGLPLISEEDTPADTGKYCSLWGKLVQGKLLLWLQIQV